MRSPRSSGHPDLEVGVDGTHSAAKGGKENSRAGTRGGGPHPDTPNPPGRGGPPTQTPQIHQGEGSSRPDTPHPPGRGAPPVQTPEIYKRLQDPERPQGPAGRRAQSGAGPRSEDGLSHRWRVGAGPPAPFPHQPVSTFQAGVWVVASVPAPLSCPAEITHHSHPGAGRLSWSP